LVIEQSVFRGDKDHPFNRLDPKVHQQFREAFLHALSSWPSDISMELHITSHPNLVHRPQGFLLISLFLRTFGTSKEKIKENIIARYLTLKPIMEAHFPETEFVPITDYAELDQRFSPFAATHAMAVCREEESICLSTPLKRLSVGFGPTVEKGEPPDVVQHRFPWTPAMDDGNKLMNILIGQMDPIQIIIRFKAAEAGQDNIEQLEKNVQTCEIFLSAIKEYQITLNQQVSLIRDVSLRQLARLTEPCFKLGVFILASHPIDKSIGNVLARTITCNDDDLYQGRFACKYAKIEDALDIRFFPEDEPFTLPEAASAFILPAPAMEDYPGLPVKRFRTSMAHFSASNLSRNGDIDLFVNEHQGMTQPVKMEVKDRMRHTFILGQTGTGKSTLMENMIIQDIHNGKGMAVIDPHGELVDSILGSIPKEREEDVILFDPLDRERPLGFNLLQWKTVEERDLIIDEIYLTIDHLYCLKETGGPIFETNFRGMLKLLMGNRTEKDFIPTLLEFSICYQNHDFRKWLLNKIKDPQVHDFINELERTSGDASLQNLSPYITSKFSRFTNDTALKRIIGQERTSFDFDEIMNTGKIFLVKLGKGRFGSTVSALLANQMVARFKMAAMKRGDLPQEARKEFYLYVDECHNLPSENFMELLSEARKYRLGLILATQYTAQIAGNGNPQNNLLSAITGNVGTFLVFRLGYEDAEKIGKVLLPCFNARDIIGLPNWHGYARMQIGNEATQPFSFKTVKNKTPFNSELSSRIKILSRLKYGTDTSIVDAEILHRRFIWKD